MASKNTKTPATTPPKKTEPVVSDAELKMPEEDFGVRPTPTPTTHLGFILGALIVVLILLLGGLYLWSTTFMKIEPVDPPAARPTAEENNEPESTNAEAEVETMNTMSTSDELDSIEADINNTPVEDFESEMQTIEAELDPPTENQ